MPRLREELVMAVSWVLLLRAGSEEPAVSWVLVLRAGSEEPAVSWVLVLRAVGLLWAVFEARKSPNRGKVVSAKAAMEI